jgi:hypothetical protein
MKTEQRHFKITPTALELARHYNTLLTSATRTFSERQKMTAQVLDLEDRVSNETPSLQEHVSQYQPGVNASGLHPLGRAVLLWPLETGLKVGKIHLPDSVRQRQMVLDTVAWVVEMGRDCNPWWSFIVRWFGMQGPRCKVGDAVIVAALSGSMREGKDGVIYRFVNHRDIYGLVDQDHPMLNGGENA